MTVELGLGKDRIDGVRFHMFGWWEFSFDIDAAQGKDRIVLISFCNEDDNTWPIASSFKKWRMMLARVLAKFCHQM